MVAGIGLCDGGILAAGLPAKLAGIHNHTAQRGSVTADELGCRVDHNVCAVLNGADQIRSPKGVVDHQRQAVLMGNGRNGVNVGDVRVGIAQRFQINGLGVGTNCPFHLGKIVSIHKGGFNAVLRQGVGQQVVAATVDGFLGNNVVVLLRQRLDGVRNGGRTGSNGQRSDTTLQSGNSLFQHILSRVSQAAVDVACIGQPEASGGVCGIVKHIGSGLVNGNGSGIGGGVSLLLTNMKLQGFKFIFTHNRNLLVLKYNRFQRNPIFRFLKKQKPEACDELPGKWLTIC